MADPVVSNAADALVPRAPRTPKRTPERAPRGVWAVYLVLGLGAILMVFPFIWQLLTAFKTYAESTAVPPVFLPADWQWENFVKVFDTLPFAQMFLNSVIITVARVIGQVVLCTMAGYAFARMQFPGKNLIFVVFLSC